MSGPVHKPRVLFVSHTAEWTGPTNSLLLLVRYLIRRFDIGVLLPGEGEFVEVLKNERISYFTLPSLRKWSIPSIARLIRREGFDLVYGNNTSSSSKNALIAAKIAGVPFIYHIRAMARSGGWRKVGFLRFADAAIAVSEATAKSYAGFLGGQLPHVVHNGVSAFGPYLGRRVARQRFVEATGLPPDALAIISVGNIDWRKAPEYAVRAMARITKSVPSAFLTLIGRLDREPEHVERVRSLIRELGLEERILLLGFRADVLELLGGADLLLHTATEDPHPRVVIEAMASALPVVAFSVDGVAETVLDGKTGYLVPVKDTESLAQATLRLIKDVDLRREFGHNGLRRATEHFSAEQTAQKVASIIEGTLDQGRQAHPGPVNMSNARFRASPSSERR